MYTFVPYISLYLIHNYVYHWFAMMLEYVLINMYTRLYSNTLFIHSIVRLISHVIEHVLQHRPIYSPRIFGLQKYINSVSRGSFLFSVHIYKGFTFLSTFNLHKGMSKKKYEIFTYCRNILLFVACPVEIENS